MGWLKRLFSAPQPKLRYEGLFKEVCRFCGDVIENGKGFGGTYFCSQECLDLYQGRNFTMMNGFKVREIRERKGMTPRALSAAAGLEPKRLARIERYGPQDLELKTAEAIAAALGVELRDILALETD